MRTHILGWIFFCLLCCCVTHGGQESCWFSMGNWQGYGVIQTDVFEIRGHQLRMRYNVPSNRAFLAKLLSPEGGEIRTLLLLRKNVTHGKGMQTTKLSQVPVQSYLRMEGPSTGWNFSLEQYVSDVDRWELLQSAKQQPALIRFAEWGGEAETQKSVKFSIPSSHWKITAQALEADGALMVEITDASGHCVFRDSVAGRTTRIGWCHKKGDYILRIFSSTAWNLRIEMD